MSWKLAGTRWHDELGLYESRWDRRSGSAQFKCKISISTCASMRGRSRGRSPRLGDDNPALLNTVNLDISPGCERHSPNPSSIPLASQPSFYHSTRDSHYHSQSTVPLLDHSNNTSYLWTASCNSIEDQRSDCTSVNSHSIEIPRIQFESPQRPLYFLSIHNPQLFESYHQSAIPNLVDNRPESTSISPSRKTHRSEITIRHSDLRPLLAESPSGASFLTPAESPFPSSPIIPFPVDVFELQTLLPAGCYQRISQKTEATGEYFNDILRLEEAILKLLNSHPALRSTSPTNFANAQIPSAGDVHSSDSILIQGFSMSEQHDRENTSDKRRGTPPQTLYSSYSDAHSSIASQKNIQTPSNVPDILDHDEALSHSRAALMNRQYQQDPANACTSSDDEENITTGGNTLERRMTPLLPPLPNMDPSRGLFQETVDFVRRPRDLRFSDIVEENRRSRSLSDLSDLMSLYGHRTVPNARNSTAVSTGTDTLSNTSSNHDPSRLEHRHRSRSSDTLVRYVESDIGPAPEMSLPPLPAGTANQYQRVRNFNRSADLISQPDQAQVIGHRSALHPMLNLDLVRPVAISHNDTSVSSLITSDESGSPVRHRFCRVSGLRTAGTIHRITPDSTAARDWLGVDRTMTDTDSSLHHNPLRDMYASDHGRIIYPNTAPPHPPASYISARHRLSELVVGARHQPTESQNRTMPSFERELHLTGQGRNLPQIINTGNLLGNEQDWVTINESGSQSQQRIDTSLLMSSSTLDTFSSDSISGAQPVSNWDLFNENIPRNNNEVLLRRQRGVTNLNEVTQQGTHVRSSRSSYADRCLMYLDEQDSVRTRTQVRTAAMLPPSCISRTTSTQRPVPVHVNSQPHNPNPPNFSLPFRRPVFHVERSPALQSSSLLPPTMDTLESSSSEGDMLFIKQFRPLTQEERRRIQADRSQPSIVENHSTPPREYQNLDETSNKSNDGSYMSQLSQAVQETDPDDDAAVSAFLMKTKGLELHDRPRKGKSVAQSIASISSAFEDDATTRARLSNVQDNLTSSSSIHRESSSLIRTVGADTVTGITTRNGARIGTPIGPVDHYQNVLPYHNSLVLTRTVPLIEGQSDEIEIRERIEMANDDFKRLKEECLQFPLREEHFKKMMPGRKDPKAQCGRLEKNADGTWLEKAYCWHHQRWEFSHLKGLNSRRVAEELLARQHRAGKVLVVVGVLLLPVGGFKLLNDMEEDNGSVPELMRLLGGTQIDTVHQDERALASFWLNTMLSVWLAIVAAALVVSFWALSKVV